MSKSKNLYAITVIHLFPIILVGAAHTSNMSMVSGESPCDVTHNATDVISDCRARNIQNLSTLWVPMETSVLLLDYNCLTTLTRDFFQGRSHLRYLSAAHCSLSDIEHGAFTDVTNLKYLNLEYNLLPYSRCGRTSQRGLPPGIFTPLTKLQQLLLTKNDLTPCVSKYNTIIDWVFRVQKNVSAANPLVPKYYSQETKLEFLAGNSTFPSLNTISLDMEFLNSSKVYHNLKSIMPNLSNLYLNTRSGNINNLYFSAFRNLQVKRCHITATYLQNIHMDAFLPFRHLESISLINSPVGLYNAISSLAHFANKTLHEVRFDNVNLDNSQVELREDTVVYKLLRSICIEKLSLRYSYNEIFLIDVPSVSSGNRLLSCTKYLDLSGNAESLLKVKVIGYYDDMNLNLSLWKLLEEVKLTNLQKINRISDPWEGEERLHSRHKPSLYKTCAIDSISALGVRVIYPIPESLRLLNRSNSQDPGQIFMYNEITFDNASQLTDLDFSSNGFSNICAVLKGLPNLRRFYFSNNNLSGVNERFLDHLRSLESIDLSSCQLQSKFMLEHGQKLFISLKMLTSVDLSNNHLEALDPEIFAHNNRIRHLNLCRNSLTSLPIRLFNTHELRELDMKENNIKELAVSDRKELDDHYMSHGEFRLQIQDNLFSCGCEDISFLVWLRFTRVPLDDDRKFPCLQLVEDQPIFSHVPQGQGLRALWRHCVGKTALLFSLIAASLYIIGLLLVVLFSRHKRYVKAALMKMIVNDFHIKTKEDYAIGVFIGYAEQDYQFPCLVLRQFIEDDLGLTCYLRDRDLIPNQPMADSIVEAINKSWRTLLVVTPSFLFRDEWGHFTAKTCVYAQRADNPHRLLVLVDHVTSERLPTELLSAVSDDNVICVPRLRMSYELRTRLMNHRQNNVCTVWISIQGD